MAVGGSVFGSDAAEPAFIRGINVKTKYKILVAAELVIGDGHRLPPRLAVRLRVNCRDFAPCRTRLSRLKTNKTLYRSAAKTRNANVVS